MKGLMKKYLVLGLMLLAGTSHASCLGSSGICWDDTGLYIQGRVTNGAGEGIPSLTLAQMNVATPKQAGQLIFVSDGLQGKVCVSSGTGAGAYLITSATSNVVVGGLLGHCN